jgi:Zn-finger nucleic acid-binding protein
VATPVGTIVCPTCAAGIPKDAKACPYCGAEVVLPRPFGADAPAELKTFCPRCGQLYPSAAAKCPRCPPGSTDERGGRCPRCAGDLEPKAVGRVTVDECRACHGTWFDGDELEHAMDLTTRGMAKAEAGSLRASLPTAAPEREVRYLACVRCGERMARKQIAPRTGLIVDVCRFHGIWFDAGEIEHFRKFVAVGGLEVVRVEGVSAMEAKRREVDASAARAAYTRPDPGAFYGVSDGSVLGIAVLRSIGRLFRHLPF